MSEVVCEEWTTVAPGWGRLRHEIEATGQAISERLLAAAALRPGEQVLELAAGTGELAARLATSVQPGGSVVASDGSAGMVELIRERHVGDETVEVRLLDATDIDLPADSFDAVVFRMGLMLVADPTAALQEIRRVLRPGGRVALAVWGDAQHNPWMTSVGMACMMHGLVQGPPPNAPGGPLSLGDPDLVEKLVRNAGFTDVTVRVVDDVRRYESADAHFDMVRTLAPPLSAAIAKASAEQIAAVRQTVFGLTEQYRDGDALNLPCRGVVCVAR